MHKFQKRANEEGGCCYYERKGNPSGTNHEPQYEKNGHHTDGPRGHEWADRGPDRYGTGREPGGGRRGQRRDRACRPGAARPPAERAGRGAHPPPVREHDARAGPEREGARQYRAECPEDGGGRGLDAREHRRGVRGPDAAGPRRRLCGMHGMGDAAPCHDVPAGQGYQEVQRPGAGEARGPGCGGARRRYREDGVYGGPGELPRGHPGLSGTGGGGRRFQDR